MGTANQPEPVRARCARVAGMSRDGDSLELRLRTSAGEVLVREPTDRLLARTLGSISHGRDPANIVRGRDTSVSLLLDALEAADAVAAAVVVRPTATEADHRYGLRVGTISTCREVPLDTHDALSLLVSARVRVEVVG